jgi:hypothetical protein
MELKDIRVFVCVPAVGKSYLCEMDDRFVDFIETKYDISDDIDNYHYFDLKLTEDEQKLVDMHGKEIMEELRNVIEKLSGYDWVKYYVNLDIGLVRVIKPVQFNL